jgi:hypothetical protein
MNSPQQLSLRVLARNADGLGPPALITGRAPAAPSLANPRLSVTPTNPPTLVIALGWFQGGGAVPPVSHFILERSTNGGPWSATTLPSTGDTVDYDDTGLAFDTEYRYRVAVMHVTGQSPWSRIVTVRTPSACPDRTTTGSDGTVLVTLALRLGRSCAEAAAEQDRIAGKEMTFDPTGLWGDPGGSGGLEPCQHFAFASSQTRVSIRYVCSDGGWNGYYWFVISYPAGAVHYPP